MQKKQIAARLFKSHGRSGVLKRNMPLAIMLVAALAALMANYAFSAESVYDRVPTGNYVDVGLDTARGIKMDLVENGLTHKVVEFKLTAEIPAQDIQLLIAENNFDAKNGNLARYNLTTRQEALYETLCNPYNVTDVVNGSVNTVQNCTSTQTGIRNVDIEEWMLVDLKLSEKNGEAALGTFGILGKGRYKYSFDTPIVRTENGWGNKGTVFLKIGNELFVDKQHSSWWDTSYQYKRNLTLPGNLNNNETFYVTLNTSSLISTGKLDSACSGLHLVYDDTTELDYNFGNYSFLKFGSGCNNTNSSIIFKIIGDGAGETKKYAFYYSNINDTTMRNSSKVFTLFEDFSSGTGHNCAVAAGSYNFSEFTAYATGGSVWNNLRCSFVYQIYPINRIIVSYQFYLPSCTDPSGYSFGNLRNSSASNNNTVTITDLCAGSSDYDRFESGNQVITYKESSTPPTSGINYNLTAYITSGDGRNDLKYKDGTRSVWGVVNTTRHIPEIYTSLFLSTGDANHKYDNLLVYLEPASQTFTIGAEETNISGTTEDSARSLIVSSITNVLPSAIIYTDQQMYVRYLNGTQMLGTFDKVAVYGNQRWAFNYITGGESYTYMGHLAPVLYVWENTSLGALQIQSQVEALINSTKA